MKLATQIILLGATSVSLLFFVMVAVMHFEFPAQQDALLQQGGLALAENIRLQIEPMILTDDRLSLNDALAAAKLSDENIGWIFVLDNNKTPLASTYSTGVPQSLIDFVWQKSEEKVAELFIEGEGSHLCISLALMNGDLGSLHVGINRDSVIAFANARIFRLIAVFSIISVVAIALAVLIGRGVGKPLSQIVKAIGQVEGRWPNLEHLNAGPTLEVQEFFAIFKEMVKELEQAERKRQDYEHKLMATERLASIGELASEVAHEINNPLDGLIEITRYLEQGTNDPQKVRKYIPLLKEGLERIEKTGRQLLSFSRSDGVNYKEVFDLCKVINNTVALLSGSMKKRRVTVNILCKEGHFAIGSPVGVGQAVMNLLLNASDALSPQGGRIDLEISSKNGNVIITVTDNGPGISEQISENIFEAFFSTRTSEGGTGLGLAVSQRLIKKCGGELFLAERKVKGGGAKFVIKLRDGGKKGKCHVA